MALTVRSLIVASLSLGFVSATHADDQTSVSDQIEVFPTLDTLCGLPPEAPKNTRPTDIRRPISRKVRNYLKSTSEWIACADTAYEAIQKQLDAIDTDVDQKPELVDFLNQDFEASFEALNGQIILFSSRLNRQNRWFRISPEINETQKSYMGCGEGEIDLRLCRLKDSMVASHGQRSFETDRVEPVKANTITAPVFLYDGR